MSTNRFVYAVTTRPDGRKADEECMDHIPAAFDDEESAVAGYCKAMNALMHFESDDPEDQPATVNPGDLVKVVHEGNRTVFRDPVFGNVVKLIRLRVLPLT